MKHALKIAAALAFGISTPVRAGGGTPPETAPPNPGNWCELLQNKPGLLYRNPENPILESFLIGGRFQYQTACVDGEDVNGRDFHNSYDEYRRFRFDTKIGFLRYFSIFAAVKLVTDDRRNGGDPDWGFQQMEEAYLTFDIGKAFGSGPLDSLTLSAGCIKLLVTEEVRESAKEIITIERSAIANKLYNSGRPTGFVLKGAVGSWTGAAGVFSSTQDEEFLDGWNDGTAFYLAGGWKGRENLNFTADFTYCDNPANFLGYQWASSLSAVGEQGPAGFLATVALGENYDSSPGGDTFYGFVAMPWYWIVGKKLQAVLQYQYSGSEGPDGIRANSRYFASAQDDSLVDVNGGRGDSLHTVYAGLNYYLCGSNAKIMGGLEWTALHASTGSTDALTYAMAFRTFF